MRRRAADQPNASLQTRWDTLCARFLPLRPESSIWRYSRTVAPTDPAQGWKLHISATILTAVEVLERVAPLLARTRVLFKAPVTLRELMRLNCGLFYGFSQVGKFITVYPRDSSEAAALARELDRQTRRLAAPAVPYDIRYRPAGCVYYRYGAFGSLEVEQPDGTRLPAIRDQSGNLMPDLRAPGAAAPVWAESPFRARPGRSKSTRTPLSTTIRAYEAIAQRGKGGVYRALDMSTTPMRRCVLKEGRRHGETDWDGRDGRWRVRHEMRVLSALSAAGVSVPLVYSSFGSGPNFYLALELIEGRDLQTLLARSRRLPLARALDYGRQIAELLARIHDAGWVWRDCKPLNLIVTAEGAVRPLDFEGACRRSRPDPAPWGTAGYVPPEWMTKPRAGASRLPEDLYALGATLRHLLDGRPPAPNGAEAAANGTGAPPSVLSRRVPLPVREIIAALLERSPQARPDARTVARVIAAAERRS